MNSFVVEVWKRFDLDTANYQWSSSQIRCLQDRKSCQEIARIPTWTGNHSWFHVGMIKPSLPPHLPSLPTLPTFPTYLTYLTYLFLPYLHYLTSLPSKFVQNTGHSSILLGGYQLSTGELIKSPYSVTERSHLEYGISLNSEHCF